MDPNGKVDRYSYGQDVTPEIWAELQEASVRVPLSKRTRRTAWPIPAEVGSKILARLTALLDDPELSPKTLLGVIGAFAALQRLDLEAVSTTIKAEAHEAGEEWRIEMEKRLAALEET